MSSSDTNKIDEWARHYAEASRRRRERGWHRREDKGTPGPHKPLRPYLIIAAILIVGVLVALLVPIPR
jgi:hypothetical protein